MKDIEVELKFFLKNPEELLKKLNKLCKDKFEETFQKDTYFNSPHLDFLMEKPVSRWLRLRETNNKYFINYKNWHKARDGEETTFCDEFESEITNIKAAYKLLKAIDFNKIITVEKNRRTWLYKSTEVAIDTVKELGDFIEIEAKGNFNDEKEAEKHLYSTLKELKAELGKQDFKGYPYLLLEKKKLI